MLQLDTPILLLVFNRLETTQRVFEKVKSVKPRFLYIASDGARINKNNESFVVNELRSWLLENIDWNCEVKTLFRDTNLGCGLAVSSAIDWFFNHVESGIILEDDCLPNSDFFSFCEELLIKYESDSRIMHIAGTNLFSDNCESNDSYHFSKYANVWGWATWRRSWIQYDFNISKFSTFRKTNYFRHYFNYLPAYVSRLKCYSSVFENDIEKRTIDTWDYQWCFTCVSNSGMSIVPKSNLIKNIGFDNNATHTVSFDDFYSKNQQELKFPLKHPEFVMIDHKQDLVYEKKIFGSFFKTLKIILIDFIRKYVLKRNLSYLKYIRLI